MPKMPRGAGRLYFAWIAVFVGVVWLTLKYETQAAHFYGIAETKETVVNTETPVEIKKIAVIEGQVVDQGQLLVQLSSPEMTLKINQLTHQVEELKAAKGASKSDLRARIAQLRAERASKAAEIKARITQLENQYQINKSLTSGLKSLGTGTKKSGTQNPITLSVAALKRELALSLHPLNIRIKALQQQLGAPRSAANIQVLRLEQQLALLREEHAKLKIFAQISGVIGSVNFKPGAKVAPFAAILTLHPKTPSFIKGYIHENMHSSVALHDQVKVRSVAGGGVVNAARSAIAGEVVGVGSRIVAYPRRLCKHQDLQLWGREILVRIPTDNDLILGEKVMIETRGAARSLLQRVFSPNKSQAERRAVRPEPAPHRAPAAAGAKTPGEVRDLKHHVEASAVHYLPDLERYLLLSDDTPDKRPLLFLMDRGGLITDEVLIEGLKKVNDLEAVAADPRGRLYLACSQNRSRRGKLKRSRRLLLRVTRRGKRFTLDGAVDLYTLLESAARASRPAPWAKLISEANDVDVEGLAFFKGALLLGYKAPLSAGRSVILRLGQPDALFSTQQIPAGAVSIFKRLRLQRGDRPQERISGLLRAGEQLFITSTVKGGRGSLWRVAVTGEQPRLIRSFARLRPEGLSLSADPKKLMVVFDQGGAAASRFSQIKVAR